MKKLLLTGLALAGFSLGVFAQGNFWFNLGSFANGLATIEQENMGVNNPWYSGTAGFEVWEMNAAAVPAGFNSLSPSDAYAALTAGWKLEATYANQAFSAGGPNTPPVVQMADVSPAGGNVVVAIAAWNNSSNSWNNFVAGGPMGSPDARRYGVLAFTQSTANYNALPPPPTPLVNWPGQDLVMTPVPEPSIFALAGLGAAALLIFRRRK